MLKKILLSFLIGLNYSASSDINYDQLNASDLLPFLSTNTQARQRYCHLYEQGHVCDYQFPRNPEEFCIDYLNNWQKLTGTELSILLTIIGPSKEYDIPIELYDSIKERARMGFAMSQFHYGLILKFGKQQSFWECEQPKHFFKRAANNGYFPACYENLVIASKNNYYYDGKTDRYVHRSDVKTFIKKWEKLANQGCIQAQFFLGEIYNESYINGPLYNDADRWNVRSICRSWSFDRLNEEKYIKANLSIAEKWYKMAAKSGHAIAQHRLGSLYAWNGEVRTWEKPYDSGHSLYPKLGGWRTEIQIQWDKKLKQAFHWYQEASKQGHEESSTKLQTLINQIGPVYYIQQCLQKNDRIRLHLSQFLKSPQQISNIPYDDQYTSKIHNEGKLFWEFSSRQDFPVQYGEHFSQNIESQVSFLQISPLRKTAQEIGEFWTDLGNFLSSLETTGSFISCYDFSDLYKGYTETYKNQYFYSIGSTDYLTLLEDQTTYLKNLPQKIKKIKKKYTYFKELEEMLFPLIKSAVANITPDSPFQKYLSKYIETTEVYLAPLDTVIQKHLLTLNTLIQDVHQYIEESAEHRNEIYLNTIWEK